MTQTIIADICEAEEILIKKNKNNNKVYRSKASSDMPRALIDSVLPGKRNNIFNY